jgi:hypothetical protein
VCQGHPELPRLLYYLSKMGAGPSQDRDWRKRRLDDRDVSRRVRHDIKWQNASKIYHFRGTVAVCHCHRGGRLQAEDLRRLGERYGLMLQAAAAWACRPFQDCAAMSESLILLLLLRLKLLQTPKIDQ